MIIFMTVLFSLGMAACTAYIAMVIIEAYNDAKREAEEYRMDNESERKGK